MRTPISYTGLAPSAALSNGFVRFDSVLPRVKETLAVPNEALRGYPLYVIRDLYGKVRLAVAEALERYEEANGWLRGNAQMLCERLGNRSFPAQDATLFLDPELMAELHRDGREIAPGLFWVDRLLTGKGWWTVDGGHDPSTYTLYSVKGGVGRSTTAAVLAWHLASSGEDVLVVDLDLESPGLCSAVLAPEQQPTFGVVDWFVEDLVGQGHHVIDDMIAQPTWHQDLRGDVCIVPAHGAESGEYLAKLGRVYLDTNVPWAERLKELLEALRAAAKPSIVLLESRSGLHDIAAATVTDMNAQVLLFATDSETTWQDYGILFRHWRDLGLARTIREQLHIVSSLTPDIQTAQYMDRFRQRSWSLFQDYLYDDLTSADEPYGFAFELLEDHAPHDPIPIHWTRGLATGTSLRAIESTTVEQAYGDFFARFDGLANLGGGW